MSATIGPGADAEATATLELSRADTGFAAAHFSVIGGRAERLHGHNYRVSMRVHGTVGSDGTVVDFTTLKDAIRAECDLLDERTLIPTRSDVVSVAVDGDEVLVREGERRFVFPRGDVQLLAVANTTCECLAAHLLGAVRARLGSLPVRLEMSVEEVPGQGATMTEEARSSSAIIDS
jgi:6-pyruvoyltetrahydropterin/6-carboxytetrahydropterin synthase